MMKFQRTSLRLLNTSRGERVSLYLTEIISMSPSEKNEIRASPVCGEMEYVDEGGLVTILRLGTISGSPLGERVLCYLKQPNTDERYLVFSRYAQLILNGGNLHSRTTALVPVEGDPNKFLPEDIIIANSLILTSIDGERSLVISAQEQSFLLAADLMLGVYNHTQEKNAGPARYQVRSRYQEQPKEILVVRTRTYSHGLDALGQYLPFLGTWTWSGIPR